MMSGVLYLLATPIGNLQDLTFRGLAILQEADAIACEDTRITRRLLEAYGVDKPLFALHQHNERAAAEAVLARVTAGEKVVLVSDAGTPVISDPGALITQLAHQRGINIMPMPGPNAAVTALCASGLTGDSFTFAGFIPAKSSERLAFLRGFVCSPRTVIFYESPHRILASASAFQEVFDAERTLVVARELTKTFEQIQSLTVGTLLPWLQADENHCRGEFVLVLAGQTEKLTDDGSWQEMANDFAQAGLSSKDAATLVAKYCNASKKVVYQYLLTQKNV